MKAFSTIFLLAAVGTASATASLFPAGASNTAPASSSTTTTVVIPPSATGAQGTGAQGTGAAASSGFAPGPNNSTATTLVSSVTHTPVGPTTSAPSSFTGGAVANGAGLGLAAVGMGFALFL